MGLPIAIIGAGIAGSTAAHALHARGLPVRVFDKGRVAGGRASTRMRGPEQFDHGAQYFTARDPSFLRQVSAWQASGKVAEWNPRLAVIDASGLRMHVASEARWVGVPGMRHLALDLLTGIDLVCNARVTAVQHSSAGWWLHFAEQPVQGPFSVVLCTLPPAQAVQLLSGMAIAKAAESVEFAPCWALMLSFAQTLPSEWDGAFINDGPLSWIARDSSKPGRPLGERWVVHANTQFSQRHLEAPAQQVEARLLDAFRSVLNVAAVSPVQSQIHRWRYALASPALDLGILADEPGRIALGGDWCNGSRVEGASLSGLQLADWAAALV